MPFGLRNAAHTLQRFMNEVVNGLNFLFVYLDDILIASKTEEEHQKHLNLLFHRLDKFGLNINVSKCIFGANTINFLSHKITVDDILPSDDRVKIISEFHQPNSIKQLQRFIGMINYYHRFIPKLAELLAPIHSFLTKLLKKPKNDKEFIWTEEIQKVFNKIKTELASATLLKFPKEYTKYYLMVDASNIAVGAVLQQLNNNLWEPIAFFSKKLSDVESKYSTFDRELLPIYLSIKHFRYFLEGRDFTIYTDHKPLTKTIFTKTERSPRQSRQLDHITQFTTDIQHIKGYDNVVADTLSRITNHEINEINSTQFNIISLHNAQELDIKIKNLIQNNNSNSKFILKKSRKSISKY